MKSGGNPGNAVTVKPDITFNGNQRMSKVQRDCQGPDP